MGATWYGDWSSDVCSSDLYVSKLHFRRFENFSTNTLALILASTPYNENDYIRNFDEFLTVVK
jgi:hypothetical protein